MSSVATTADPGQQDYILCPFTCIIDTQEGAPYTFRGIKSDSRQKNRPLIIPTKIQKLKTGDYSIEGMEDQLTVERKSLSDAYGTFGRDRARFERELERMSVMKFAAVIIEAGWGSIIGNPPDRSKLSPKSFHRSIIAWNLRYPTIHFWTLDTRTQAEITCFRILERAFNKIQGNVE